MDTSWKVGLIGRNGRGKSTLLKLIYGALTPTRGTVLSQVHMEIYPYELCFRYDNVLDFIKENIGKLKSMEEEISYLEMKELTSGERYAHLLNEYNEAGGYTALGRIKKEFYYMGLDESLLERNYNTLSGGERTKIEIIILFLRNPDFVLLDEPTNHLDSDGSKVLLEYLKRKKGYIIVSHDRAFLDYLIDHVISINKSNISIEKGNFSSWKENKDHYERYEQSTKKNLERKIHRLEKVSEDNRKWSDDSNLKKYAFRTNSRNRSSSIMKRALLSEHRIQNSMDEIKGLLKNYEEIPEIKIDQEDVKNKFLIKGNHLAYGYGNELLFNHISFEIKQGDRLCIKGKNGSGKSTLLNMINGEIHPKQGTLEIGSGVSIAYSKQLPLYKKRYLFEYYEDASALSRVIDFLKLSDMDEEIYNRPLETLSLGELKKMDIARVLSCENNILLLDEPLNYTDIYFREQLEQAILTHNPTLIFVEHDTLFCNNVATKEIEL